MTTFSQGPVRVPRQASPRLAVELAVAADRDDLLPLTGQLAAQLRDALAAAGWPPGAAAVHPRAGRHPGVSRTVVTAAYTQLFAEGWLEGRHGSGTYVAQGAAGPLPAATAATAPPEAPMVQPDPVPSVNLCPGIPWQAGVGAAAWRRAWRHAGTEPVFVQPDPRGRGALREALTGYLRRSRGSAPPGPDPGHSRRVGRSRPRRLRPTPAG